MSIKIGMEVLCGPYHCHGFELTNAIVPLMLLQCPAGICYRSATGRSIALLLGQNCTKFHSGGICLKYEGSSKLEKASTGGVDNNSFSFSNAA